jgi:hypothetical protein
MSALTVCAASKCDYCAAAQATHGGVYCQSCLEAEHPDVLEAFSRSFAALELESCRQDCPPPYRDHQCKCSDIYMPGKGGGTGLQSSLDDAGYDASGEHFSEAASDAGNAQGVLKALEDAASSERCYGPCRQADWSCLDSLHMLEPPEQEKLELNLTLVDISSEPVAGARVRACLGVLPDCGDTPLAPRDVHVTDADGFTQFLFRRVTSGAGAGEFFGALEVTWGGEDGGDPSSALLYFVPSLTRSPSWTLRRLVSRSIADASVELVLNRKPRWQDHGGIVFSAVTCNGLPAADVVAELDGAGADAGTDLVFYSGNGWALDPTAPSTSTSGLGAFVDVLPGARTLTLYHVIDKKSMTRELFGTYPIHVRKGTITTLALAPYGNRSR